MLPLRRSYRSDNPEGPDPLFVGYAALRQAVGIGRPFLWGLGAFGQAGVDRVIEILQGELKLAMGNCGTQTVAEISRAYVATPDWKL